METENGKISARSKCDLIMESVTAMLVRGQLRPGDRVPSEAALAAQYGVSRATVREAFKKLSAMGVVSIRQGDGTFIRRLSAGELARPLFNALLFDSASVESLYEARKWIEAGCASLAARGRPDGGRLDGLRALMRAMREAAARGDAARFSQLDVAFHREISNLSGNYVLSGSFDTIQTILSVYMERMMFGETLDNSLCHHARIFEAIEQGDTAAAELAMKAHIEDCKTAARRAFERQGSPSRDNNQDNNQKGD